jgi:hypothetical protein
LLDNGPDHQYISNNWKPDFNTNVSSNPGGDGIVIFVGLAAPPSKAN